jgi:hypothetical protein
METIREGSTGPDVVKWQTFIGVTADGNFGPQTKATTVAWQTAHGLTGDGVVGPATWAASGLSDSGASTMGNQLPPPDAQASIDKEAYAVAKRAAPNMPEKQRQYALSVARGEGHFGHGWASPSSATIAASQSFGLTGSEGTGSNNWGAVQGTGSAGSFQHVDYHADGTPYVAAYKKYSTPEEGFLDMARILFGGGKRGQAGAAEILTAIEKGSLRDAVYAQHANGYFELAPEKYLAAVVSNYLKLTSNIGWSQLLSMAGGVTIAGFMIFLFGLGSFMLWRRSQRQKR